MSSVFNSRSTVAATTGCITQDVTLADIVPLGNGVVSDISATPGGAKVRNIVLISQALYDALPSKDDNTLYVIAE
jgi:uncharacterized membrane protein